MNLEQDLFRWLNETHDYSGQEEGLLLAPMNAVEPEHIETVEDTHTDILVNYEPAIKEPQLYIDFTPAEDEPQKQTYGTAHDEPQEQDEPQPPQDDNTHIDFTHEEDDTPATDEPQTHHDEDTSPAQNEPSNELWLIDETEHEDEHSREWQEAHTGFTLSLDEPPPEIWTRMNSLAEDDDEEEEDYEQGMSLQGAAYIPKQDKRPRHGMNFTQRLQRTLQGRKERAEKLREEEESEHPHHPYIHKAVIMCGTLLVALVLSWVCLWFMQDGVAVYIERAQNEQEHTQPVISEDTEPEEPSLPPVQPEPEPVIIPITPKNPTRPAVQTKSLLTFDEALTEGNNNYNIGMFSRAVLDFHRALALRDNDIRPYIGLAASYRAKGMYFDAKRLLDEARIKFGINPAIDMELYYLRRE